MRVFYDSEIRKNNQSSLVSGAITCGVVSVQIEDVGRPTGQSQTVMRVFLFVVAQSNLDLTETKLVAFCYICFPFSTAQNVFKTAILCRYISLTIKKICKAVT